MNVYNKPDLLEGMVYIFSGMLRDYYEFKPGVELFADNRFPWEKTGYDHSILLPQRYFRENKGDYGKLGSKGIRFAVMQGHA